MRGHSGSIPIWKNQIKDCNSTTNQWFKPRSDQAPFLANRTHQLFPGNEYATWSTPQPSYGNPNPLWGQAINIAMNAVRLMSVM